jgi:2-oxoglutarate dehydrogenase complex dehydrogenase (E1) component-like enzyme
MARTDELNDIFASTSFLYGGNAHYIEELYAQFQDNPARCRRVAGLFRRSERQAGRCAQECARRVVEARQLADAPRMAN